MRVCRALCRKYCRTKLACFDFHHALHVTKLSHNPLLQSTVINFTTWIGQCSRALVVMFGNFNLNAGLSQLQDLGGRFQKIKEDLEQNIESSLRTNIAPSASGDEAGGVNAPADGVVAFGGDQILMWACKQHKVQHFLSLRAAVHSARVARMPLCHIVNLDAHLACRMGRIQFAVSTYR